MSKERRWGPSRVSPSIRSTGFSGNKKDKHTVREPGVTPDKEEEAGPSLQAKRAK